MSDDRKPGPETFLTSPDVGISLPGAPGDNPVDNSRGALPLVLFDGDCGFCASSVAVMRGRWFRARVTATPFQRVDVSVHNLTVDKCGESLHVVDGVHVHTGGDAIARILRNARCPWPAVGVVLGLPGVRWVTGRVYALVARNRHRLPGGTPSCEL